MKKKEINFDMEAIMLLCIQAAKQAQDTLPNPRVGAALVDNQGQVIQIGYHQKVGHAHAEVEALKGIDTIPKDAILFCTLEPCNHFGRTPPCTELIIQKNIKRVVIGTLDPNPQVLSKGVARLEAAGIDVFVGCLEKECRAINSVFNKNISQLLPYVSLKIASSLDGKIALSNGQSQWITNEYARQDGHHLRSQFQAIAVGINTVIFDNPQLNNRQSQTAYQPIRIVFDSFGKTPFDSNFIKLDHSQRILCTTTKIAPQRLIDFQKRGVSIIQSTSENSDLLYYLKELYTMGVYSIMLEGGAKIISAFIKANLVDQIHLYLSGIILGQDSMSWMNQLNLNHLNNAPYFYITDSKTIGDHIKITLSR